MTEPTTKKRTFTCRSCLETFFVEDEDWSEDDANAEAEAKFGVANASEDPRMAVVCEECWKAMGFGDGD